jgi:hypothetical protein
MKGVLCNYYAIHFILLFLAYLTHTWKLKPSTWTVFRSSEGGEKKDGARKGFFQTTCSNNCSPQEPELNRNQVPTRWSSSLARGFSKMFKENAAVAVCQEIVRFGSGYVCEYGTSRGFQGRSTYTSSRDDHGSGSLAHHHVWSSGSHQNCQPTNQNR